MTIERRSFLCFYGLIFLMLTCYFVWNGSWYDQASLEIKGTVSSLPTGFDVAWDSGNGLNSYERYKAILKTQAATPENQIQISYTDKKNSASLSKKIFCRGVFIDGHRLPGSSVELNGENQKLSFSVVAGHSIAVELGTDNRSGLVSIMINGVSHEYDLYVANVEAKKRLYEFWLINSLEQFTVKVPLPRYHFDELVLMKRKDGRPLSLNSVDLRIGEADGISLVSGPQTLTTLKVESTSSYQKRYFTGGRFFQQLLFAALATWLISAVIRVYQSSGGYRGIARGKQLAFVCFFIGAIICYLSWLLIVWPGVMSVDSLKVWRAAQLPEVYLNDHPILNVFFYMFLYHIWNNPAVVPLFQVLATSILTASIFYTLYRNNVSLWFILPFYLFTVSSIPIGLYNTVLWKDVPFALLIVFWAYIAALLYQKKRSQALNLSREQVLALFLMLLSLGFIRHNGIIYLVFIPALLILTGVIRLDKRIWLGFIGVGLLVGVGGMFMASGGATDSGYLIDQGRVYLEGLFNSTPSELLQRTWQNYWGILDINQTDSKWDLYHRFLKDRYAYKFLHHAGWNDVYPYLQSWNGPLAFFRDLMMGIYWGSYQVPVVYLSWNPVWAIALFPLCVLFFRWLPLSAIFSSVILVQIFTLSTLLDIMNWRYFYFVCVASYFIIPMVCFDIVRKRQGGTI